MTFASPSSLHTYARMRAVSVPVCMSLSLSVQMRTCVQKAVFTSLSVSRVSMRGCTRPPIADLSIFTNRSSSSHSRTSLSTNLQTKNLEPKSECKPLLVFLPTRPQLRRKYHSKCTQSFSLAVRQTTIPMIADTLRANSPHRGGVLTVHNGISFSYERSDTKAPLFQKSEKVLGASAAKTAVKRGQWTRGSGRASEDILKTVQAPSPERLLHTVYLSMPFTWVSNTNSRYIIWKWFESVDRHERTLP